MYKEAHFQSTTHELLSIIKGSATLLLGGADEIASHLSSGSNSSSSTGDKSDEAGTWTTLDVSTGDVLLLPAGYSHRALQDRGGFTMIGSYPRNGKQWDSEFRQASS
ncbi:hypothetical protein BCV69DRAFT_282873 [Microstroma glucosiphilum]|uniref:Cupin type-1 domain-containing protein n=1 Tax=Pseudomicrostroma glucosiphilum TaxID=1684307 RepID=A0A316U615_9BASI|nr:hypothetical protein BCV69DRAFT_282873 [Pseudomicrostroma glucosiphilum]PWN20652.1 hypothetical protein BCV69DRAFT_282873 [Pseudomicrostroma glucosiphilum]